MKWSEYTYLAAAAVAACALFILIIRYMRDLSAPSKRRTTKELVFLAALLAVALFVIYGNYYLGNYFFAYTIGDTGSDTVEQYVPFYANLIGNVQDDTFSFWNFWSFEYELGVNATSYQSWLFDPFNLLVVPLGLILGGSGLPFALLVTHTVKIVLSAFLFDHLLTRYCETPVARILGSTLYALCGFMIINGQHYWLGSVFPLFTFLVLMFELYLEKMTAPRFLGVTAAVAIMMGWTAYVAFMILLYEAIFLLLKIPSTLDRITPKAYLMTILRLVAPVVCGILVAGALFVPYAYFLLVETSRTSASSSMLERIASSLSTFIPFDWFLGMLSRFLGSCQLTTGLESVDGLITATEATDYSRNFIYEFIFFGYSCGAFVLLSQFFHWIFTERPRRTKILVSVGTALILLYCVNYFLPTLFTAMVRLQFRSSFILAAPICIAMALGFEKRILPGKVAWKPLLAAAALTIAVLLWSFINTRTSHLISFVDIITFVIAVAALALALNKPAWRPALTACFAACLVASTTFDGFMGTNLRIHVAGDYFPLSGVGNVGNQTEAALDYLKERDKTFYRVDKTYLTWVPANDSLIQHYASVSAYNSTPDAEVDEFYKKLWHEAISPWAYYSQGYWYDRDRPDILQLLDVKYILSLEPIDYSWCELITNVKGTYIYRNKYAESIATVRQHVVRKSTADALPDPASRRELLTTSIIVPDEIAAKLTNFTGEAAQPAPATSQFVEDGIGHMSGTISCDQNSVVCLSIPHTGTWHIFVDGKEVETFTADYGFIGFTLAAGDHEITASYELAGARVGLVCTGIGALGTAGMAYLIHRSSRRRSARLAE